MVNVSNTTKEKWNEDSVHKTLSISFRDKNINLGNDDIRWEKFELTEAIETSDQLNFTGCTASRIKFECKELAADVRGEYLTVSITADGAETIPLFAGYVDTQKRPNKHDLSCTITAYDVLYKLRNANIAAWFNNYSFPSSLRAFRTALAAECGISMAPVDLIFDTLQIEKTIETNKVSPVDLLKNICQLNGVYGRINRSGAFQFVSLGNTDQAAAYQISPARYKKIDYENYETDYIDKVQIRADEDDIGAIYGGGTNAYIVEGNWITYGRGAAELATMAQALYAKISSLRYNPLTMELAGLPFIEPGDIVETTTDSQTVRTYVLNRTLKGIQLVTDKFTSNGGKTRSQEVEDVNVKIDQLAGKTNRLTRDVEQTKSSIEDLGRDVRSEITQTADAIEIQINSIYKELDGSISTYYTDEAPTLLNYPAWDFTYGIPCNNTVQTKDDLKFTYTDEYYHKNLRALVYDRINGTSYRFRLSEGGTYFWEEVTDTEYGVLMQKVTALEVKDGEITASIEQITKVTDDLGSTTEKLSSRIDQTATDISLEVSRAKTAEQTMTASINVNANAITSKVSKGNVSSEISQEAGKISIRANRLEISSTNFTLATDGTMTCKNATISGYTKTAELSAEITKVNNLIAAKASIDQLNATNAAVNNLSTSKASVDQLNAVAATVNKIDANYITAGGVTSVISNAESLTTKNLHIRDGLWMTRADTGNDTKVTLLQRITVGSSTWLIPAIKL